MQHNYRQFGNQTYMDYPEINADPPPFPVKKVGAENPNVLFTRVIQDF